MEQRYYFFYSSTLFSFWDLVFFSVLQLVLQCFYLSFSSSISWYFVLLSMRLPQLYPKVFFFFFGLCTYNFKDLFFSAGCPFSWHLNLFLLFLNFPHHKSSPSTQTCNFTILAHLVSMVTWDASAGSGFFFFIL